MTTSLGTSEVASSCPSEAIRTSVPLPPSSPSSACVDAEIDLDADQTKRNTGFSGCSTSSELVKLKLKDKINKSNKSAFGIFLSNAFTYSNPDTGEVHFGLYPLTAKLNHSCRANVGFNHDPATWVMRTYAVRDIEVGEELLHCYSREMCFQSAARRQRFFQKNFRFLCACAACKPTTRTPGTAAPVPVQTVVSASTSSVQPKAMPTCSSSTCSSSLTPAGTSTTTPSSSCSLTGGPTTSMPSCSSSALNFCSSFLSPLALPRVPEQLEITGQYPPDNGVATLLGAAAVLADPEGDISTAASTVNSTTANTPLLSRSGRSTPLAPPTTPIMKYSNVVFPPATCFSSAMNYNAHHAASSGTSPGSVAAGVVLHHHASAPTTTGASTTSTSLATDSLLAVSAESNKAEQEQQREIARLLRESDANRAECKQIETELISLRGSNDASSSSSKKKAKGGGSSSSSSSKKANDPSAFMFCVERYLDALRKEGLDRPDDFLDLGAVAFEAAVALGDTTRAAELAQRCCDNAEIIFGDTAPLRLAADVSGKQEHPTLKKWRKKLRTVAFQAKMAQV
ncbi:unnamed protein product [Amoebophrya sp. A25]|nr:unnamed protein product [Amoebophrya sp. A25]|eukprot:GSA25T00013288001.1